MQVKKNPKVDLNKDSGLFFVIGLAVVLFITWRALEYKSYPTDDTMLEIAMNTDDLKDEEVPITQHLITEPPPPPPAAPEVIEIVEDTEEIEETVIESTETSQ